MIGEPPLLVVKRSWDRPSEHALASFAGAQSSVVADSQGGRGALDWRIKAVTTATRFTGPALTVTAGPSDVFAPFVALNFARPGDVLVIATGEARSTAVIGDLFVGMARNCGVAAIVTDGLVRDVVGMEPAGIPVFAAGVSPNSPYRRGPGRIGEAISLGGIAIASGDILIGDGDGVAVVPLRTAGAVAARMLEVLEQERAREAAIREGMRLPPWVAEFVASSRIEFED